VRTDYPVAVNIVAPGPHEVVVSVAYVAINPIDYKMLEGHFGGQGDRLCGVDCMHFTPLTPPQSRLFPAPTSPAKCFGSAPASPR
jgi:hypothetical protein